MRKVMVSEEKWNNKTNRLERIDLYEAWFHQFGNDECGENVVTTIAIVERIDNGQVEVVFPGNIRFVDEINRKCRALTEKQINDIVGAIDMADIIIVPVSGGKDSQVVLSLAIAAGHMPVCVHQDTGYDHPATYQHMIDMEKFYGVKIERTHNKYGGMFGFLEHAKYFPNSAARGCTQRLKQEPFSEWLTAKGYTADNSEIWFGMRSNESANRSKKYGALMPDDVFTLGDISAFYREAKRRGIGQIPCRLPIVDWDTKKVFDHLTAEGAPINLLYSKGHIRVGCYPCLLARKSEWQAAAKDPIGVEHLKKLIALEDKWVRTKNTRKYIKVHRVWNVRDFLDGATEDLMDINDHECGYCSI